MKGLSTGAGIVLAAVIIVGIFGLLIYTGKFPASVSGPSGGGGTGTGNVVVVTSPCGDDQKADHMGTFRNILATAASDYAATTATYVDELTGEIKGTSSITATSTPTSTADVLECGKQYSTYILNSATQIAPKVGPKLTDSPKVTFAILGANSTDVQFKIYTSSWGNETTPDTLWQQDVASSTNNAMDLGSTLDMRFDIQANSSSAQFGSMDSLCETDNPSVCGKAFVCGDFNLAKYQKSDVAISYPGILRELSTLPKYCQINAYEKAWEIVPFLSTYGTQSGTIHIAANAGAPADADNVKFIWVDNGYYTGQDGKVKVGTADDASTDTGETNRYLQISVT